ncbi:hypothetical protein VE03_00501 [Pseudogymnoascus sp. 23342-1-I1]|nr:hypothetical protein VE03_00501 [Pseudogymnoascus sp. 23342-1-I1]
MAETAAPQTFDIPATYKAAVYDAPGTISTKITILDTPTPGPGEVLVRLTHSGVCHSDLGVMTNSWKGLPYPTQPGQVGGHEGVGVVHKLGPAAGPSSVKVGDRVGIKWLSYACGTCPACATGAEGVCFNQKISGYYTPGTFQQYVLAPATYVTPIPSALSSSAAAPLLCAGLTSYAALRKSSAQSGQFVVVAGAGGGLGHLAIQIGARGMGLRMIGVDHGSKEALVMESGAEAFFDVTKFDDAGLAEEVKRVTGGLGAHAVLVCTAVNRAYAQSLGLLRFGGTVVCVGMPEGEPVAIASAVPGGLIAKQLTIVGSAVGNQREAGEVLELAARGLVETHLRVEKLDRLTEVFKEMEGGKLQGRVVIDLE